MGKVQTLETGLSFLWKVPKGKINSRALGYVCPNGQINFQNEASALQYTKNTILKALKQGKERMVITKDANVLKVSDGGKFEVELAFRDFPQINGCNMFHGHPNVLGSYTFPFSELDTKAFLMLNKVLGYKKSVVYNSIGEECSMTMKSGKPSLLSKLKLSPDYKFLLYDLNPLNFFRNRYIDKAQDKFNKNIDVTSYLKNLNSRCTQEEKALVKELRVKPEEFRVWVENKINALIYHDGLKKYTTKLGIDYKTTFSHLKDEL